ELPRLTALLRSLGYDSAAITNTPIPNDLRWRRRMIRGFITSNLSVLSEDSIAQCPAPSDAAWTTALEEVRDFDSGARRTALDLAHIWRHLQPFHANLRMGSPAVLFLLTACRSDESETVDFVLFVTESCVGVAPDAVELCVRALESDDPRVCWVAL